MEAWMWENRCLIVTVFAASLLGACGGATDPTAGAASRLGADIDSNALDCRRIAYETVQNLPAVRSGRTTYIPGGAAPYYETCMQERGFTSYPPY
jgi:hypothetical protein